MVDNKLGGARLPRANLLQERMLLGYLNYFALFSLLAHLQVLTGQLRQTYTFRLVLCQLQNLGQTPFQLPSGVQLNF